MDPVEVVNIALTEIGSQSTISSFDEGSTEAEVAKRLYAPKITALMRAAHWNCLREQRELTQLKAVVINGQASDDPPPRPWLYEYAYPSDCVQARFILPYWQQDYTGVPFTTSEMVVPIFYGGPPVKFVVATDLVNGVRRRVILTDMPQAILVYTGRFENCDLWDTHFLAAATSSLGAWFVNALNRNRGLLQDQTAIARGVILEARVSDGNEGLQNADNIPDWIQARMAGGGGTFDGFFYPWSSFSLPGMVI